jgi:hypothetical protein
LAKIKGKELDVVSDFESEKYKGKIIIDVEPNATITSTKIQPKESYKIEEG